MNTQEARYHETGTDMTRFRLRAVVDWIECEFETTRSTNAQTVKRAGHFKFVVPINLGSGSAATIFRIRFQDPGSFGVVQESLRKLSAQFPLSCAPTITGVEVSLDAYLKSATPDELPSLAARWYKHLTTLVSPNRRFSGRWKGDVHALWDAATILRLLQQDRVIFIGERDDDLTQRIYVKQNDAGRALEACDHRARIEVTIRNEELPMDSLEDWGLYRFESLSRYFRFRRQREGGDPVVAYALQRAAQTGERRLRRRAAGGRRLFGAGSAADTAMNKAARDALRELSRRWAGHRAT